jgi:hypothetical protein
MRKPIQFYHGMNTARPGDKPEGRRPKPERRPKSDGRTVETRRRFSYPCPSMFIRGRVLNRNE